MYWKIYNVLWSSFSGKTSAVLLQINIAKRGALILILFAFGYVFPGAYILIVTTSPNFVTPIMGYLFLWSLVGNTISNPISIYLTEGRIPAQIDVLMGYTPEQVRIRQDTRERCHRTEDVSTKGSRSLTRPRPRGDKTIMIWELKTVAQQTKVIREEEEDEYLERESQRSREAQSKSDANYNQTLPSKDKRRQSEVAPNALRVFDARHNRNYSDGYRRDVNPKSQKSIPELNRYTSQSTNSVKQHVKVLIDFPSGENTEIKRVTIMPFKPTSIVNPDSF
jgi:hypothetical protein